VFAKVTKFCNFNIHKKRLPEDDVNTLKNIGGLYEIDITVNIL
jgi:hypothetical protein